MSTVLVLQKGKRFERVPIVAFSGTDKSVIGHCDAYVNQDGILVAEIDKKVLALAESKLITPLNIFLTTEAIPAVPKQPVRTTFRGEE